MVESDLDAALARIKSQAESEAFRVTLHAQEGMAEEAIGVDEVLEALQRAEILEHYPQHRRGACCLVFGATDGGRPLHLVCTTALPLLILIAVYEPRPPKWVTPRERSRQP